MNVADQLQKIGILLANNLLVKILEEMAHTVVATVEVDGIPGQQTPHETRQFDFTATHQHVGVIREQRPRVTVHTGFQQQFAEPLQKAVTVMIVNEDVATFNAADHDVLQKTRAVEAGGAGHRCSDSILKSLNQERPLAENVPLLRPLAVPSLCCSDVP
jgi:hypothetical protein